MAKDLSALLAQKELIAEYLRVRPCDLSVAAFANIYIWGDFFDFEFRRIDDSLILLARDDQGCFCYLPPLGADLKESVIDECFRVMARENKSEAMTRIENVCEEDLRFFPKEKFAWSKKYDEYGYDREDLTTLAGNAYKSKRSAYNQFVKAYLYQYLPYEPSMKEQCCQLYAAWAENRRELFEDDVFQQMLEDSRRVLERVLDDGGQVGIVGRVVMVEGRLTAFTFGYPVNNEVFCVLFEVTDLNVKGAAVFIFREFCRDPAVSRFRFINAMDDFGMENIRATKASFRPVKLWPVYSVTQRK